MGHSACGPQRAKRRRHRCRIGDLISYRDDRERVCCDLRQGRDSVSEYSTSCMDIRADELPISACAVNSCPVPDKSTRCQSVRPVRMSWPSVWSEVSGAGDSDQPVTTFYTSVPSARVPQRELRHGHSIGPGQVARSPLEHRLGPTSDDNRCLDRSPLNQARAGQSRGGGQTYLARDNSRRVGGSRTRTGP